MLIWLQLPSACLLKIMCHYIYFLITLIIGRILKNELSDLTEFPYPSVRKHPVCNDHGLGLLMVARITRVHYGKLVLTSNTGKGLTVSIELPIIKELL